MAEGHLKWKGKNDDPGTVPPAVGSRGNAPVGIGGANPLEADDTL